MKEQFQKSRRNSEDEREGWCGRQYRKQQRDLRVTRDRFFFCQERKEDRCIFSEGLFRCCGQHGRQTGYGKVDCLFGGGQTAVEEQSSQ